MSFPPEFKRCFSPVGRSCQAEFGPDSEVSIFNHQRTSNERSTLGLFNPTAAVVVLSKSRGESQEWLVVQRKREPNRNCWSFPGGRRKIESIVETAMREAKEETGVEIHPHELGGPLIGYWYPDHRVIVFNAWLLDEDHRRSQSLVHDEGVQDVRWVDRLEFSKLPLTPLAQVISPFFVDQQPFT